MRMAYHEGRKGFDRIEKIRIKIRIDKVRDKAHDKVPPTLTYPNP